MAKMCTLSKAHNGTLGIELGGTFMLPPEASRLVKETLNATQQELKSLRSTPGTIRRNTLKSKGGNGGGQVTLELASNAKQGANIVVLGQHPNGEVPLDVTVKFNKVHVTIPAPSGSKHGPYTRFRTFHSNPDDGTAPTALILLISDARLPLPRKAPRSGAAPSVPMNTDGADTKEADAEGQAAERQAAEEASSFGAQQQAGAAAEGVGAGAGAGAARPASVSDRKRSREPSSEKQVTKRPGSSNTAAANSPLTNTPPSTNTDNANANNTNASAAIANALVNLLNALTSTPGQR